MADFRFKSGFRSRGRVSAQTVGEELVRIEAEGGLTAERVFEAARPLDAPLHPEFEWDGEKAIRELGLLRASALIRAVIEVRPEQSPRRIWVRVSEEGRIGTPGRYERIAEVVRQPDLFEQALTELQRKFDAAEEALAELRQAAQGTSDADRIAAIGLAVQGFGAVREALAILK